MTRSTAIYRAAAKVLSHTVLRCQIVKTVFIRRSAASGEAVFPWSDLDLAILIRDAQGFEIDELRLRYLIARILFPRLGECQVMTRRDLAELCETDPYRASLDRRCSVTVFGPPPVIQTTPVTPFEAARRLVFWFDRFIPAALRHNNRRNLQKFALEMANALGVLEGRWAEPLTTRAETARRIPPPSGNLFADCCGFAARAHALLRPPAPRLQKPLKLPGLLVLPSANELRTPVSGRVMTPEALDLLIHTQNPWLWHEYGGALGACGFEPPPESTWRAAARRYAAGERLRGPGFLESGTGPALARIRAAASALSVEWSDGPQQHLKPSVYYLEYYDWLSAEAEKLRRMAAGEGAASGV